ncbi:MAG: patatin-like phospholipase family protein, partial [Actinobacteria bacterium]|nr:patatin-like phospholipase family protein [Actinomycetota bacterium]
DLLQQAARASNGTPPRRPADPDAAMAVFRMWGRIQKFTDEEFAEVGRAAAALDTMSEDEWLAGFSDNAWPGWPEQPLVICAVDCESGALRAFDATDGVPIERAVAASCAVPGMFPPVTIGRRRYTDGGLRYGTSAERAGRIDPDVVRIIAPMGVGPGGVNRIAAHQLAREIPALERGGAAVTLVQFDDTVRAAIGASLMDPAGVAPAREGGRANGRRLAQDLRATWMR